MMFVQSSTLQGLNILWAHLKTWERLEPARFVEADPSLISSFKFDLQDFNLQLTDSELIVVT